VRVLSGWSARRQSLLVGQPNLYLRNPFVKGISGAEKQPRLQQRCNEVASNCGGGPLVGRVRSAGRFQSDQSQSYSEWWATASPEDRLLSLSDIRGRKGVTQEETAAMANIQCPFRGSLEFVVAEEEDGEDDAEASET